MAKKKAGADAPKAPEQFIVKLSPQFHTKLKALCALLGVSMGKYVEEKLTDTVQTQFKVASERVFGPDDGEMTKGG